MKTLSPILRLVLITSSVLIVGLFGVVGVRIIASMTPPQLAQLPQVPVKPLIFALGDIDHDPKLSLDSYNVVLNLGERVIPAIEVRPTPEREWVLFRTSEPEVREGLPLVTDFLKRYNPKSLLVMVHSREVAAATSLLEILGERPEPMRTFIYSPNHRLNREFRKKRPLWFSGGDASSMTQWHVFAALWLEPMATTDFDWLLRGGLFGHSNEFAPRVREELSRRQIGEIKVLENIEEKFDASLYGVLTNRPTALLSKKTE